MVVKGAAISMEAVEEVELEEGTTPQVMAIVVVIFKVAEDKSTLSTIFNEVGVLEFLAGIRYHMILVHRNNKAFYQHLIMGHNNSMSNNKWVISFSAL